MSMLPTMLLEARGLTAYREGDAGRRRVLDGIDLQLGAGTLTDVFGPSGAGKTTLLLALARLLPDVGGDLTLRGVAASGIDSRTWRRRVAYLPQRGSLPAGTVGENLTLPWRLRVRAGESPPPPEALRAALDSVHLSDVALERDAARLSEGQAARVALLRTVLTEPDVLLLDEPDASLDEESATQVGILTRAFVDRGGAVLRVRHQRSDGRSDRRIRLRDGHLTEEAPL